MKRAVKRVWSVLLICLLAMTFLPPQALAQAVEIGETGVSYEFQTTDSENDTLVFSGQGEIDRDALDDDAAFKEKVKNVSRLIIEAGVTGISDYAYGNSFIPNQSKNIQVIIKGGGDFRLVPVPFTTMIRARSLCAPRETTLRWAALPLIMQSFLNSP